jgi:hypothetical protein
MKTVLCIAAVSLSAAFIAPAAEAKKPTLVNLTKVGNKIADGNAACPETSYFLYSGGYEDNFAGNAEPAYPSVGEKAYFDTFPNAVLPYDSSIDNAFWGDSFTLQNSRNICHAIVQFRVRATGDLPSNDFLSMVHFNTDGTYYKVASVEYPALLTGIQSYALDAIGLANLAAVTHDPVAPIFDPVMEDDTAMDFFRLYVWYAN